MGWLICLQITIIRTDGVNADQATYHVVIVLTVIPGMVLLLALKCLTLYHRHMRDDSGVYKHYLIMLQVHE